MLTHVYHHDESTPYVTSVTFPMSSTQDTTDLDLRYYGTNLRWVSMLFTHQQCSRYECGPAKKFPRPKQWRALQGAPDLLQLEPNLELSGEFQQDLDSRRWSSCLCLGSMYESSRGCVPQIVFQTIIFFIFSLLENSTSSPTGREAQLSSLKAWTTLALVRSSILKRTSTNLLGKELIASPMAPGNSWSPGLPVLKVNFNILIKD